ncbi:hypothetical protein D1007_49543 [Hordeum vulgare]|nr:hypothetical protein D1007_49543 [Hordeum vulgare]
MAAIRCDGLDLQDILQYFSAKLTPLPMTYLGLPFSVTSLKTVHFLPLEDKIAHKLAPWIGKLMVAPRRTVLVKAVLTAIAIYTATSLVLPAEVMKMIDAMRHAFLWAGCDKVTGGKCKINWERVCRSMIMGGLGVLNQFKFATALRLRWLWFEWASSEKPWLGLGNPYDDADKNLFAVATTVKIKFTEGISASHIQEFATLWEKLQGVVLDHDTQDTITWKFTDNGSFSTSSAYKIQFEGRTITPLLKTVWKV